MKTACIAVIFAIFGLLALALYDSSGGLTNNLAEFNYHRVQCDSETNHNKQYEKKECEGFWYKAITDPAATFTGILTLATILLFGVTAGLWRIAAIQGRDTKASIQLTERTAEAALEANRLSRNMFVAEQRPWVKIKNVIVSELAFDDLGLKFQMKIHIENIGKSPAKYVSVCPSAHPEHVGDSNFVRMNKFIIGLKSRHPFPAGTLIFPGDPVIEETTCWIEFSEINKIPEFLDALIIPMIIVIIDYRNTFDTVPCNTAAIFHLNVTDAPPIKIGCGSINPAGVRLIRFTEHDYAD